MKQDEEIYNGWITWYSQKIPQGVKVRFKVLGARLCESHTFETLHCKMTEQFSRNKKKSGHQCKCSFNSINFKQRKCARTIVIHNQCRKRQTIFITLPYPYLGKILPTLTAYPGRIPRNTAVENTAVVNTAVFVTAVYRGMEYLGIPWYKILMFWIAFLNVIC